MNNFSLPQSISDKYRELILKQDKQINSQNTIQLYTKSTDEQKFGGKKIQNNKEINVNYSQTQKISSNLMNNRQIQKFKNQTPYKAQKQILPDKTLLKKQIKNKQINEQLELSQEKKEILQKKHKSTLSQPRVLQQQSIELNEKITKNDPQQEHQNFNDLISCAKTASSQAKQILKMFKEEVKTSQKLPSQVNTPKKIKKTTVSQVKFQSPKSKDKQIFLNLTLKKNRDIKKNNQLPSETKQQTQQEKTTVKEKKPEISQRQNYEPQRSNQPENKKIRPSTASYNDKRQKKPPVSQKQNTYKQELENRVTQNYVKFMQDDYQDLIKTQKQFSLTLKSIQAATKIQALFRGYQVRKILYQFFMSLDRNKFQESSNFKFISPQKVDENAQSIFEGHLSPIGKKLTSPQVINNFSSELLPEKQQLDIQPFPTIKEFIQIPNDSNVVQNTNQIEIIPRDIDKLEMWEEIKNKILMINGSKDPETLNLLKTLENKMFNVEESKSENDRKLSLNDLQNNKLQSSQNESQDYQNMRNFIGSESLLRKSWDQNQDLQASELSNISQNFLKNSFQNFIQKKFVSLKNEQKMEDLMKTRKKIIEYRVKTEIQNHNKKFKKNDLTKEDLKKKYQELEKWKNAEMQEISEVKLIMEKNWQLTQAVLLKTKQDVLHITQIIESKSMLNNASVNASPLNLSTSTIKSGFETQVQSHEQKADQIFDLLLDELFQPYIYPKERCDEEYIQDYLLDLHDQQFQGGIGQETEHQGFSKALKESYFGYLDKGYSSSQSVGQTIHDTKHCLGYLNDGGHMHEVFFCFQQQLDMFREDKLMQFLAYQFAQKEREFLNYKEFENGVKENIVKMIEDQLIQELIKDIQ